MPEATLSSKYQLTLPMEIVRALGLKPGAKLVVVQVEDHLALFPKPASYASYLTGSLKGTWGTTEEIDRYIAEERASWGRDEWQEQVEDLLAANEGARQVVEVLSRKPDYTASRLDLRKEVPEAGKLVEGPGGKLINKLDAALPKLLDLGAVREIEPHSVAPKYRLVRRFVRRSTAGLALR